MSVQAPFKPAAERRASLPPFTALVAVALVANAPVIGFALLRYFPKLALSDVAGCALGLAVYGSLYVFITRGLDGFVAGMRGTANPEVSGKVGGFALLLSAKFLVLGILVYCLVHVLAVNLIGLVVGAVLTQLAVSLRVLAHMRTGGSADASR